MFRHSNLETFSIKFLPIFDNGAPVERFIAFFKKLIHFAFAARKIGELPFPFPISLIPGFDKSAATPRLSGGKLQRNGSPRRERKILRQLESAAPHIREKNYVGIV